MLRLKALQGWGVPKFPQSVPKFPQSVPKFPQKRTFCTLKNCLLCCLLCLLFLIPEGEEVGLVLFAQEVIVLGKDK